MPKLPSLSAADERRILSAIDAAAADPRCDDDPDRALAKAADAAGVPLGHVGIMARAYNTARSALRREEGATAAEKAAAFPLADPGRILALAGRPAGERADPAAARDYARPPTWADRRPIKAAADRAPRRAPAPAPAPADPEKFASAVRAARSVLARPDRAREEAAGAAARGAAAMGRLAEGLRASGAPSFTDVKLAAAVLHGPAGERALDAVYPMVEAYAKLGAARPYHDPAAYPAIYGPLAEAVAAGRAVVAARRESARAGEARRKEAVDLLAPYADAALPPAPGPPPIPEGGSIFDPGPGPAPAMTADGDGELDPLDMAPGSSLFDDPTAALPAGPKLAAGNIPAAVGVGLLINKSRDAVDYLMSQAKSVNDPTSRAGKVLGRLNDPDHEAELADIDTRAALATMVHHDPVLSSYDPRELARAFNEIADVAPGLARKPLMARPLLRKYLTMGHLDSFEGGEAVKAEKGLRELGPPPASPAAPRPEAPKK